jgi:TetR/AcrR family transcriptional repressor of nem operon
MLSKGYAATSVDEICDAAGVSKGSFYHFFRTKEELGLAVLDAFHIRNGGILAEGVKESEDPVGRSLALVDHLLDSAGTMWGKGCLLGSFAMDLAETNPAIREAVSEKFRAVASVLGEGLEPLAVAGGGPDAPTGAELAEQFIVVVEGALVLARAHNDWSYVERALERFRGDIHKSMGVVA